MKDFVHERDEMEQNLADTGCVHSFVKLDHSGTTKTINRFSEMA